MLESHPLLHLTYSIITSIQLQFKTGVQLEHYISDSIKIVFSDPDPYKNETDPWIRIRIKMNRIRNH